MVFQNTIISNLLIPNIGRIVSKLNELLQKIPKDEKIRKDKLLLLSSIKSSFSSLKIFSNSMLPHLESLKRYFQLSDTILNRPETLNDDDKLDLEAIIQEICEHAKTMMHYQTEQQKFQDYHLDLEKLKLKIADASKFE